MNVQIIYASLEGQTAKIARFIENELIKAGHTVDMVNAHGTTAFSLDRADRVILAAPVHERRHPNLFEALIVAQRKQLEARDTLLISVSLSAAFPEGLEEAQDYLTELEMRTGFTPSAELLVAGAIRSGEYDYFAQQVLRHVVLRNRDVEATSDVHEFTDWDTLRTTVRGFMAEEPVAS